MTITRKQYMAGEATHDEFYKQFANPSLISYVANRIGRDRIKNSTDASFNDIPLIQWDSLSSVSALIDRDKWREATGHDNARTYPWAMSDQVCIAKAAASIIRDED